MKVPKNILLPLSVIGSIGIIYLIYNFLIDVDIDHCLDRGGRWNYEFAECEYNVSDTIANQFKSNDGKFIDLSSAVPGAWDKVCFFGPYSNNDVVKVTLGFFWDVESRTTIQTNEGISLLLFIRGNNIFEMVEHSRADGDFSNLSGQCFPRNKALFEHDPAPRNGWTGLFSKA